MRSLKIMGTLQRDELVGLVEKVVSEIEGVSSYKYGNAEITIIGAGKFFLRTSDRVGFYLLSAATDTEQRIDYSAVGGGSGLLGVTLGSKQRFEEEIGYALESLLEQKGFRFEEIKDQGNLQ